MEEVKIDEGDFMVDVGRASEGRTYVKVVHLKSSRSALRVGIGNLGITKGDILNTVRHGI